MRTTPRSFRLVVYAKNQGRSQAHAEYTYVWEGNGAAAAAAGGGPDLQSVLEAKLERLPAFEAELNEALEFHTHNIEIITRLLEREKQELAQERDPLRRGQLEWRILQAESDLVAEKDLLESYLTGQAQHSRTPFDDYAHNRFVEGIREQQENMAAFERAQSCLPRLLALAPPEQRGALQAFVERQLGPSVLARLDTAQVRKVAEALAQQVQGHWEGEGARAQEREAELSDYLLRAERVKLAADLALSVGASGGAAFYRTAALYSATTGWVQGGPAEALAQAAQYYSAPLAASVEALRAYPEGGAWEAVKAGAVGFMLAKLTQLDAPKGSSSVLTVKEAMQLAKFKQAREWGQALVDDFGRARRALEEARSAGRPVTEVRALEKALLDKTAAVQGDLHAKSMLKYQSGRELQRAFVGQIEEVHKAVQVRFDQVMAQAGWTPQELRPIRNASSAGTVNMDFDIMLVERPGQRFLQEGSPKSLFEWQQAAQKAWDQAYRQVTGRSAGHAMEELTTHLHPEAYKDLAWISRDKSAVSSLWSVQAGDVTRYKAQNVLGSKALGAVDYHTRLMEAARGAAKDIDTKLLDRLKAGRTHSPASAERKKALVERWRGLKDLLKEIGEGRLDPVHGDRQVRRLTGGFGLSDVIDQAATLQGEYTKRFSARR